MMDPINMDRCRVEFFIDDLDGDRSIGADIYDKATGQLVDRVEKLHLSVVPITIERAGKLCATGMLDVVLQARILARMADEKILAAERRAVRWAEFIGKASKGKPE